MEHINTIARLIEVSREYKKPLCLLFIDLKKAFDSVETEAVMEALTNQALPTPYIKILQIIINVTVIFALRLTHSTVR
ncbi:hypothetical protein DICVIV_11671 [Dictyocaulus viviparus]|uniref:Uncharacterized protein n=1 Tax=Dictyocaulus viviparus TaxID=29172 RepID=A0A0D8XF72_DICVI|nr:hypothetical protein DICVIV_11671 [Dictyocaulus viviparus]